VKVFATEIGLTVVILGCFSCFSPTRSSNVYLDPTLYDVNEPPVSKLLDGGIETSPHSYKISDASLPIKSLDAGLRKTTQDAAIITKPIEATPNKKTVRRWANSFEIYPKAESICHGHFDFAGGRSFVNVYGSNDPTSKVIRFYKRRYAKSQKGPGNYRAQHKQGAILDIFNRKKSLTNRICHWKKHKMKTLIRIKSEVFDPDSEIFKDF